MAAVSRSGSTGSGNETEVVVVVEGEDPPLGETNDLFVVRLTNTWQTANSFKPVVVLMDNIYPFRILEVFVPKMTDHPQTFEFEIVCEKIFSLCRSENVSKLAVPLEPIASHFRLSNEEGARLFLSVMQKTRTSLRKIFIVEGKIDPETTSEGRGLFYGEETKVEMEKYLASNTGVDDPMDIDQTPFSQSSRTSESPSSNHQILPSKSKPWNNFIPSSQSTTATFLDRAPISEFPTGSATPYPSSSEDTRTKSTSIHDGEADEKVKFVEQLKKEITEDFKLQWMSLLLEFEKVKVC